MAVKDGKRTEIGLGGGSSIGLATARHTAAEMREAIATGRSPQNILKIEAAEAATVVPTFGDFSDSYISSVEDGWKNPVHRQQWRNSLRDHASSLQDKPIDMITTDDVMAVLQPIWMTKAETAKRVRGRIEKILDAARFRTH